MVYFLQNFNLNYFHMGQKKGEDDQGLGETITNSE